MDGGESICEAETLLVRQHGGFRVLHRLRSGDEAVPGCPLGRFGAWIQDDAELWQMGAGFTGQQGAEAIAVAMAQHGFAREGLEYIRQLEDRDVA